MSYTPPGPTDIHFDFTELQITLDFNFTPTGYTPPTATDLHFDFTIVLFPLNFRFAIPPPPEPWHDPLWEAREKFKDLAIWTTCQLRGQIAKTWIFRMHKGRQDVYPYRVPIDPKAPAVLANRSKWATGVKAWHNLSDCDKFYWDKIGVRKKEPITSLNAFMSAWMKDQVNLATSRHIRNLQIR